MKSQSIALIAFAFVILLSAAWLLRPTCKDMDADGYQDPTKAPYCKLAAADCDDTQAGIRPGVAEFCDGKDNNCDSQVDEGVLKTFYLDADKDGYGAAASATQACEQPEGHSISSADCDDAQSAVRPGAKEMCNSVDDDCDDEIDDRTDTDPENRPNIRGEVMKLGGALGLPIHDFCENDHKLGQVDCVNGQVDIKYLDVPCNDGIWAAPEGTLPADWCTDTDPADDVFMKGETIVKASGYRQKDNCVDDNIVRQYRCQVGAATGLASTDTPCPAGSECRNGSCS